MITTRSGPLVDTDRLPCALLVVRMDGKIVSVNRGALASIGADAGDLEGAHIDRLLTAGGRVLYHSYLVPLLRLHGRVDEFALTLKRQDGGTMDMLMYASASETGDGPLVDIVMVPMRERRRVEQELLRIKRTADHAPGVLFQHVQRPDGSGHLPFVSGSVRALYGVTPEALKTDDAAFFDRVHPEDLAPLRAGQREAAARLGPWTQRFRVRAAGDGFTWHEVHATPRPRSDGGLTWHGYIADVTQRHAMEQAARQLESAERASRTKSEFLARVSHELRTPLNAIIGFARLLATDGADNLRDDQRRRLAIVESSGRSLLSLINDVLDISRIEADRLDVHLGARPLDPVLSRSLQLVEPLMEPAGLTLHVEAVEPLTVVADELRLEQVLVNLLTNAVKYNRPGGEVRLRVSRDGDDVRIDIGDDGPGLSPEQQAQLFQPFNRLGAERTGTEGSGLGLVIVHRLVGLMNGRIGLDSAPGRGSTFSVWLPAGDTVLGELSAPLPLRPRDQGGARAGAVARRRVLYVEDNEVNALLMESVLGMRDDVELRIAPDAASALEMVRTFEPELLLLDMQLPDMPGTELLAALRRLPGLGAVRAIAVSADAMADGIERARAAGFADYWTKPLDIDEVMRQFDALFAPGAAP